MINARLSLTLALAIAACGGDDSDGSTSVGTSDGSATSNGASSQTSATGTSSSGSSSTGGSTDTSTGTSGSSTSGGVPSCSFDELPATCSDVTYEIVADASSDGGGGPVGCDLGVTVVPTAMDWNTYLGNCSGGLDILADYDWSRPVVVTHFSDGSCFGGLFVKGLASCDDGLHFGAGFNAGCCGCSSFAWTLVVAVDGPEVPTELHECFQYCNDDDCG